MCEKFKMRKINAVLLLLVGLFLGCNSEIPQPNEPRTVEVIYHNGQAQLYRHGKPYIIKGGSGHEYMGRLSSYGGNSIRTWNTQNAGEILNEAESYGLTVTLGLEVGKEWWGEDFNYWNVIAVDKKIEELRKIVKKYKNHPALLMWGIGNEVHIWGGNKYIVYHTINKIAKMIHEEDPNHPTMTATLLDIHPSRFFSPKIFMKEVDIMGFNAFDLLPNMYDKIYGRTGWNKAYILSEWGPTGHWESVNTEWGAAKELSSSEKAKIMEDNMKIIENDSNLSIGSYAFYWGNKYEITHTWFSLFSEDGHETESINVLKAGWTNVKVSNHAPVIEKLDLEAESYRDNFYLTSNLVYKASIYASDPEGDSLSYWWELRHEEANFYESGKFRNNLKELLVTPNSKRLEFKSPSEIGPYRLMVFVYDGKNHIATHNVPFYVLQK
jgi:hypothetical protein